MADMSKRLHRKLFCNTQSREETKGPGISQCLYGSFEFKDRMTNNNFKYSEAISDNKSQIRFKQWIDNESYSQKKLKNLLQTYKFTKKFEMKCLRDKYFESKRSKSKENKPHSIERNRQQANIYNKSSLYDLNKREFRRLMEQGGHVNSDVLMINTAKDFKTRRNRLKEQWQKKEAIAQHWSLGQKGEKIYEKTLNHMNLEIKQKGEYLLNLPIHLKKKNLLKHQFRNYCFPLKNAENKYIYDKYINTSQADNQIESLHFEAINKQAGEYDVELLNSKPNLTEKINFLKIVRLGYVNQVFMQAKKKPNLAEIKDLNGNNIIHIAIKKSNIKMVDNLLKALPLETCLRLIFDKNKLKRTPLQKAELLGQWQIAKIIEQFLNENKQQLNLKI